MNNDDPFLVAAGLTKRFASRAGNGILACDNVSVSFPRAQTVAIVGESGCGKSTLAKMLMHLVRPDAGRILLKGEDITSPTKSRLRELRRNVQIVFQDPAASFAPRMRMASAVCAPLRHYGLVHRRAESSVAAGMLEQVGLDPELLTRYPHELSGGQLQRCAIARALTLEPRLLICDEITSALDATAQRSIIELLQATQASRGLALAFICHDLALVSRMADRVVVMRRGKVIENIARTELLDGQRAPYTQELLSSVFSIEHLEKGSAT